MCYPKPGPRCSSHAAKALAKAKLDFTSHRKPHEEAKMALEQAQEVYDSTPAGMMELERRINDDPPERMRALYEQRLETAKKTRAAQLQAIKQKDNGDIEHAEDIDINESLASPSNLQDPTEQRPWLEREEEPHTVVADQLIEISGAWNNRLTAEEMEVMAWTTGPGSSVLRSYAAGEEHPIFGYDVYPQQELERRSKLFHSAMKKAPVLRDGSMVSYRGLGDDTFETRRPSLEEVQAKFPVGSSYHPPFPESASMSPQMARNYAYSEVVLEVENKTIASPVNFSTYGSGELEVLLSPDKEYEVLGVYDNVSYGTGRGNREMKQIVVQMREK